MKLTLLEPGLAVCRLDPTVALPEWASELLRDPARPNPQFWSLTRTPQELSLVVPETEVPSYFTGPIEAGWRAFEVAGPLDFSLVGVLSRLSTTLADAGISLFPVSTFDTDFLLVKRADCERAAQALSAAGHQIA